MSTVLAVFLGLLAAGLAVVLRLQTRRSADERTRLESRIADLDDRLEAAQARERRSLEALGEVQAELDCRVGELADVRDHVEDLDAEIEAADALAADQAAELASMAIENEEIRGRLAGVQLDLAGSRKDVATLEARVAELEAAASLPRPSTPAADDAVGDQPRPSSNDATALWRLELARSERTWLYSVAMPGAPSPFPDHPDPLRLAIETEAEALCGDVGAVIKVSVAEGLCEQPAPSLLVLRLAQEILADAARLAEPTSFTVCRAGNAIEFSLTPLSDGEILDVDLADLVHRTIGGDLAATTSGSSISLVLG